jgi:hypothetical protein
MINNSQLELLESMIGSDGFLIETIIENEQFNLGIKVLYLQRAIKKDCHAFLLDLDKLYNKKIYSITKYRYDETMRIYSIIQEIFEESKTFSGRIKLLTRSVKKEPGKTFKSIRRSIAKTTNDRYQSLKKSLFETNLRENMRALGNKLRRRTMRHVRIEGGKNKPRKPKKHNKSRKPKKPRKK